MEINNSNIIAAYIAADENGKSMLRALFPDMDWSAAKPQDNRPVTERIKTFEDACIALGETNALVMQYHGAENLVECIDGSYGNFADVVAYLKLRIVCAALNEGWEPQHTEEEVRYYPWHWLYTQDEWDDMGEEEEKDRSMIDTGDYQTEYAGFAFAGSNGAPSHSYAYFGSRLCLKSRDLAIYCGKQFIDLWADFKLIRR